MEHATVVDDCLDVLLKQDAEEQSVHPTPSSTHEYTLRTINTLGGWQWAFRNKVHLIDDAACLGIIFVDVRTLFVDGMCEVVVCFLYDWIGSTPEKQKEYAERVWNERGDDHSYPCIRFILGEESAHALIERLHIKAKVVVVHDVDEKYTKWFYTPKNVQLKWYHPPALRTMVLYSHSRCGRVCPNHTGPVSRIFPDGCALRNMFVVHQWLHHAVHVQHLQSMAIHRLETKGTQYMNAFDAHFLNPQVVHRYISDEQICEMWPVLSNDYKTRYPTLGECTEPNHYANAGVVSGVYLDKKNRKRGTVSLMNCAQCRSSIRVPPSGIMDARYGSREWSTDAASDRDHELVEMSTTTAAVVSDLLLPQWSTAADSDQELVELSTTTAVSDHLLSPTSTPEVTPEWTESSSMPTV